MQSLTWKPRFQVSCRPWYSVAMPFSHYAIFAIPIAVGVLAQATKFALFTARHGWHPSYIFTHGHMPSAHTALATSLILSVGHYAGVSSGAFAVACVLAFIVVDDALRIRMYLGDQGRYLNLLVSQLKGEIDASQFPHLKERVGHKASEVIVGALFGAVLTLALIALV